MKRDNKVLSLLGNLDIALAGLTLAVLIILTVLGVAWRYVFAQPFTWRWKRYSWPVWCG